MAGLRARSRPRLPALTRPSPPGMAEGHFTRAILIEVGLRFVQRLLPGVREVAAVVAHSVVEHAGLDRDELIERRNERAAAAVDLALDRIHESREVRVESEASLAAFAEERPPVNDLHSLEELDDGARGVRQRVIGGGGRIVVDRPVGPVAGRHVEVRGIRKAGRGHGGALCLRKLPHAAGRDLQRLFVRFRLIPTELPVPAPVERDGGRVPHRARIRGRVVGVHVGVVLVQADEHAGIARRRHAQHTRGHVGIGQVDAVDDRVRASGLQRVGIRPRVVRDLDPRGSIRGEGAHAHGGKLAGTCGSGRDQRGVRHYRTVARVAHVSGSCADEKPHHSPSRRVRAPRAAIKSGGAVAIRIERFAARRRAPVRPHFFFAAERSRGSSSFFFSGSATSAGVRPSLFFALRSAPF